MMEKLSKRNLQYVLVGIFVIANIFIWSAVLHSNHRSMLTVAFLDVGQGDAIYIEAPNGNQLLIDGGPSSGALLRALGQVMPFWDRSIDVVLATHPDQDHVGGLPSVIQSMNVANVVTTENRVDTGAYSSFEEAVSGAEVRHIVARAGERIVLDDDAVLEIIFPDRSAQEWETNAASLVARLSYGGSSFLLMGDAPQSIEQYLINRDASALHANVLKLGHHGSKTSTSKTFLSAVSPEYAIISAGRDNRYGHPSKEILDLLVAFEIPSMSTATHSTIVFKTNGENLEVQ